MCCYTLRREERVKSLHFFPPLLPLLLSPQLAQEQREFNEIHQISFLVEIRFPRSVYRGGP